MKFSFGISGTQFAVLAVILSVALALRIAGAYFGLPHVYHPDEGFEVYRALRLGMGGFDFERVAKGGYYLLLFLEYGVLFVVQLATGAVSGVGDFARSFVENPSIFWKVGRVTTAILGTATVFLVWFQGQRFGGVRVGLLAAWFLATSFQHVVDSHTITVDVPMTLFTFASIVLVAEDASGRSRLRGWLFAAVAAYAIMNKLPAVVLFVPYFLGAFFRGGFRGKDGILSRATIVPAILTAVFYVAANPGFIVQFREMIQLVLHTVGGATEKSEEYGAVPLGENLWTFYGKTLVRSQGPAVIALAVWGAVLAVAKRRREAILHLSFMLPFFALISGTSSSHLYYGRYVLPILPGLCLLAAYALDDLFSRTRLPGRFAGALLATLAVLLVLEPAFASIRWDQRLRRIDTRTLASQWIETNVTPGARILLEGFPEETAQLAIPLADSKPHVTAMIERLRATDPGKAKFWEVKLGAWREPSYDLVTIRHFEDWITLGATRDRGVEWIVLRREYFAPGERHETKFGHSTLETRYAFHRELTEADDAKLVAEFDADTNGAPGYDMEIWRLVKSAAGEGANGAADEKTEANP